MYAEVKVLLQAKIKVWDTTHILIKVRIETVERGVKHKREESDFVSVSGPSLS